MSKRSLKLFSAVILFILFVTTVSAAYTADVTIDVFKDGTVKISGESNHELLQNRVYDTLTTKEGSYWVLNLTTEEVFSEYKYEINLPKNTKINYLGVYSVDTFEEENGFKLKGTVKNKPFKVVIQYKQKIVSINYIYPSLIILLIIIVLIYIKYPIKRKRKYSKDKFSEREYLIIKCLQKNKCILTQGELEKQTKLPKASLHRTLRSLELKKIIEKSKAGMSNKIRLNEIKP